VNLFNLVLFCEGDKLNAHLIIVKCKMERVLPPPPLKLDVTESCLKKLKYLKRPGILA